MFVWYVVKVVKKDRLIFTRLESFSMRNKSSGSWVASSTCPTPRDEKDKASFSSRGNSVGKSTSCRHMSFLDAKEEQAEANVFVINMEENVIAQSEETLLVPNDAKSDNADKIDKLDNTRSNVISEDENEKSEEIVARIEDWNHAQHKFQSENNFTAKKSNDIEFVKQQEQYVKHEIGSLMDNISQNESDLGTVQLAIVFENNHHLDLYCFYVHWIGLMLWTTFASWNWQSQNTNTVFILGLYVGWLLNVCMQYSSGQLVFRYANPFVDLYKTIVGQPKNRLQKNAFVQALFALNCFIILLVSCLRCRWPQHENDINNKHLIFTMYVPAFVCGVYWISLATEMAFRGHSQCQGIYFDSMRAIPTFLLVTIVTGLYSSADTRLEVFTYIQALSRFACVHLLIVQPILKACMLYIFIIQLEKRKSLDSVLAICSVLGFMLIFKTEQFGFEYVFALICTCFLIVTRCFRDQKLG